MTPGNAPLKPSIAKTVHDALPFDDKRTLGQVPDGELATAVEKTGQADAHSNGRARNAELWGAYLTRLRKQAGDQAVSEALGLES